MNAIEPIADAVTGGLVARAAEPENGVDQSGHTTERSCLNCSTPLVGHYCHACGQKGHVHRSLSAFGHDLLHGVFHFEGKIWRTLPMLAWRPGELTRRYIDGQRATFVGPLPLFLFCVFLMFAVVSWTTSPIDPAVIRTDVEKGIDEDQAQLRTLEQRRERAVAAGQSTAAIDRQIASKREDIETASRLTRDGVDVEALEAQADDSRWMKELNRAYRTAKKNPDFLLFKLKSNGYKYSWALIPLSLPLMWLLFAFSKRWRMYDHSVFVTYSLCFMTLLVVVGSLVRMIGVGGTGLLMFVPPIHMYRQLRGAYLLSRPAALWRAVILAVGAFFIAVMFGLGLLLLGLFN